MSARPIAARLVAYEPDGARRGTLRAATSWDASMPLNALGALNLTHSRKAPSAAFLDTAAEVAVEINAGAGWTEPANARYLRLVWDGDLVDAGEIRKYAMPGYGHLLNGIPVLDAAAPSEANTTEDGKRKFLSATPGMIVATILNEARALDAEVVPGLAVDFSTTLDSSGAAWASTLPPIYYEPGVSLATILENLAAQGVVDWRLQGRTLQLYNGDAALATHTGIRIREGRAGETGEAPAKGTLEGLRHLLVLRGDEGRRWVRDNPGAPTPWGKTITIVNQGGVRDELTADRLIERELELGSRERIQYTRAITLNVPGQKLPLVDYAPGNYVLARNAAGTFEDMRLQQITLKVDGTKLGATLTINDRFEDAAVRQAKRTKGIVGGATVDAGTGGTPTPPATAGREPLAPLGLVVETGATWNEDGAAYAYVEAAWDAVTTAADGLAIDVDAYELWGKDAAVLEEDLTNRAPAPSGTANRTAYVSVANAAVLEPAPTPRTIGGVEYVAARVRVSGTADTSRLGIRIAGLSITEPSTISLDVYVPSGQPWSGLGGWILRDDPNNDSAAADFLSPTTSAFTYDQWTRVEVYAAPKAGRTITSVYFTPGGDPALNSGDYWDSCCLMVLDGDKRGEPFFDGSTAPSETYDYQWTGLPNESFSQALVRVAPFQLQARTSLTEASAQPFELGTSWVYKVRAISSEGKPSPFGDPLLVTMPTTLAPIGAPSAPQLLSRLGQVIVVWDGLLDDGGEGYTPPPHFAYAYAAFSETAPGPYAANGQQLRRAGQTLVEGQQIGTTIYARLYAVDRLGNVSAPSATSSIEVQGFEQGSITETAIAPGSITTPLLAAGAVTTPALAAGAVVADSVDAGVIQTYHLAAEVGAELDISSNEAVNILVGQVADAQAAADANGEQLDEMSTRYSFTPTGAVISSPGSPYELTLSSDGVTIAEYGVPVSTWNAGQMSVRSFVGDEVVLGNHKIEKYGAGTVVRLL